MDRSADLRDSSQCDFLFPWNGKQSKGVSTGYTILPFLVHIDSITHFLFYKKPVYEKAVLEWQKKIRESST